MTNVKQEKAIELILRGETDGEVCKKIGTTRETVNKWRNHDPEFRSELSERRNQLWEQQRDELVAFYRQAIEILRQALNSPQENVRIRAALGIAKFPAIQAYLKPEIPAKEDYENFRERARFETSSFPESPRFSPEKFGDAGDTGDGGESTGGGR